MADRYPNRPFPADDYDRGSDQHGSGAGESDPLAELARLIGQTDPFGSDGPRQSCAAAAARVSNHRRAYQAADRRGRAARGRSAAMDTACEYPASAGGKAGAAEPFRAAGGLFERGLSGPERSGSGLSRAPCIRCIAMRRSPARIRAATGLPQTTIRRKIMPIRRAMTMRFTASSKTARRISSASRPIPTIPMPIRMAMRKRRKKPPKRRGGLMTVAAVLALAVVGTGAAFAYRTYVGSPRSGDPPIIRADNSPTKIVPAPGDASDKTPDRMPTGDGTEKLVPREETPVDVNARAAGPRVVFPPLNPNDNPPSPASVASSAMSPPMPPVPPFLRTARCPTASRARSGPSRSTAISPTPRRSRFRARGSTG